MSVPARPSRPKEAKLFPQQPQPGGAHPGGVRAAGRPRLDSPGGQPAHHRAGDETRHPRGAPRRLEDGSAASVRRPAPGDRGQPRRAGGYLLSGYLLDTNILSDMIRNPFGPRRAPRRGGRSEGDLHQHRGGGRTALTAAPRRARRSSWRRSRLFSKPSRFSRWRARSTRSNGAIRAALEAAGQQSASTTC